MKRKFVVVLCLLLGNFYLNAQWKQTNGPLGYCEVIDVIKLDNKFIVSTKTGVFKSDTLGSDWKFCPNIPVFNSSSLLNGKIIIAASNQLYTLDLINDSLSLKSFYEAMHSINDFIILNNKIIIGMDYSGCYISEDNGLTWTPKNNGLPRDTIFAPHGQPPAYLPFVKKYSYTSSSIVAITQKGVYNTIDYGNNWSKLLLSFDYREISAVYSNNDSLYFGVKNSLFISTDNGKTWFNKLNLESKYIIRSLLKINDDLFIGTDSGGVYNYNIKQNYSEQINNGLTLQPVAGLYLLDSIIISSVKGYGLYATSKDLTKWTTINEGLICSTPLSIASIKSKLLTNDSKKLYISEDNGNKWTDISPKFKYSSLGGLQVLSDSIIYLTASDKEISHYDYNVYYSNDLGKKWSLLEGVICYGYYESGKMYSADNSNKILIPYDGGINIIKDFGKTIEWTYGSYEINAVVSLSDSRIYSMGTSNDLNAYFSVYCSSPGKFELDTIGIGDVAIFSLAYHKHYLFAFAECGAAFSKNENEVVWKRISNCLDFVTDYTSTENNLFISSYSGIYMYSNNGEWSSLNDGLDFTDVKSIAVNDKYLYIGVNGKGIWYRSLSDTLSKVLITGSIRHMTKVNENLFFPNPTSGVLYSKDKFENSFLSIYNIMGVKVLEKNFKGGSFDISFLKNGEYFLVINSNKRMYTQKILIKK